MNFYSNRFYLKEHFLEYISSINLKPLIYSRRKKCYVNIPISFDIETSSFKENNEKRAILYAFTLVINDISFLGRSYDDLNFFIQTLKEKWELSDKRRIIIYVHNLSYEFQFLRKRFNFSKVFLNDNRNVIYAETDEIIFRCSYMLSGYSLAKLGDIVSESKIANIKKLDGDKYNYKLVRTPLTPLTSFELDYILNDGLIVNYYIKLELKTYKKIYDIPLTKTQKVRKYCKKMCYYTLDNSGNKIRNPKNRKYSSYRNLMMRLTIGSLEEYELIQLAFMGGYTHANAFKVGKIYEGVGSFDLTSSYPAVMCSELFPMSKGESVTIKNKEEFKHLLKYYLSIFQIEFINLESTCFYEHYISKSKCIVAENVVEDNGRIVSASRIVITITNIDYEIIKKHYKYEKFRISRVIKYDKGYLPKDFILAILNLYKNKTILKGIKGKEIEYNNAKEQCNSAYGMCVTNILRNLYEYDNDNDVYTLSELNIEQKIKTLEKYNNSKDRFLFYLWGLFITAYARRNLWYGIDECKTDYVYSDTDSIKTLNIKKHLSWFNRYNKWITYRLKLMCEILDIDYNFCTPKNKNGEVKPLGIWEYELTYKKFKTLGAKRYFYQYENGDYSFTISGLNKGDYKKNKGPIAYLINKYGIDNLFNSFTDQMYIPGNYTRKQTLTYIDRETKGVVIDYKGEKYDYHEYNSIHMEDCEFTLKLSDKFKDYLHDIKEIRIPR